ncbi:hypothetical protein QYF36_015339 [Acer negundo]|nr:hypothetical protein QYF36_015339 [Acer negundo]
MPSFLLAVRLDGFDLCDWTSGSTVISVGPRFGISWHVCHVTAEDARCLKAAANGHKQAAARPEAPPVTDAVKLKFRWIWKLRIQPKVRVYSRLNSRFLTAIVFGVQQGCLKAAANGHKQAAARPEAPPVTDAVKLKYTQIAA